MTRLLGAKLELADWLNPVLVRNLRQALRSNVLALTLCINQYLIAAIFTIYYVWHNSHLVNHDHFNLGYVIRVLMYIFPFYSSRMIDEEVKTKTLETLLLVNKAPTIIVYGNWQAFVAMSSILTLSYLPYTVLGFYSRTESYISLTDIYYSLAVSSALSSVSLASSVQRVVKRTLFDFFLGLIALPVCVGVGGGCFFLLYHILYAPVALFFTVTLSSAFVTILMLRIAVFYMKRLPGDQRKGAL